MTLLQAILLVFAFVGFIVLIGSSAFVIGIALLYRRYRKQHGAAPIVPPVVVTAPPPPPPTNTQEAFCNALSTLLYSWGSEAPNEAYWAANKFLDYYELVTGKPMPLRFESEDEDELGARFEEIEKLIMSQ